MIRTSIVLIPATEAPQPILIFSLFGVLKNSRSRQCQDPQGGGLPVEVVMVMEGGVDEEAVDEVVVKGKEGQYSPNTR